MEIVNIVATGTLNFDELDIEELYHDLDDSISKLKPGRLDLRFDEETPLVMIYPAGTYTIPGATSMEELRKTRNRFITHLESVSEGNISEESFSVKYMVFMSEFDSNFDLEKVAIKFGLDNVEYEPEQFPGLIYRVENPDGVILIFSSGKVLFTGFSNEEEAKISEDYLKANLENKI